MQLKKSLGEDAVQAEVVSHQAFLRQVQVRGGGGGGGGEGGGGGREEEEEEKEVATRKPHDGDGGGGHCFFFSLFLSQSISFIFLTARIVHSLPPSRPSEEESRAAGVGK